MKRFNRIILGVFIGIVLIIVGVNVFCFKEDKMAGRPYLVEIQRLSEQLEKGSEIEVTNCKYVKNVIECKQSAQITNSGAYDYCVRQIGDKLYRFDYVTNNEIHEKTVLVANVVMIVSGILILLVLIMVQNRVIKPFHKLEEVPFELSKGNLTVPIEETKYKLFGKFIWGTNMLRENIEERRKEELELHKEKKTVLLSLAHDVKTPLSVIKLNAQALDKGLYKDEERRSQSAKEIIKKVDEIGTYVSQIVSATKDDFLKLEVIDGELYLEDLIKRIQNFYKDKMEHLKIPFSIEKHSNCLLAGDIDRLEEVLQNLIENGIKYGDGKGINVSFSREEECQLITVTNTGNTLPPEESQHLFESFYRGSNSDNKEGSGLGLYICRKLMTQMKGDIFIHSEGDVFGVTIVIRML